jgi:hypothetical protein
MRRYIAKLIIPLELQSEKVGYIGERLLHLIVMLTRSKIT